MFQSSPQVHIMNKCLLCFGSNYKENSVVTIQAKLQAKSDGEVTAPGRGAATWPKTWLGTRSSLSLKHSGLLYLELTRTKIISSGVVKSDQQVLAQEAAGKRGHKEVEKKLAVDKLPKELSRIVNVLWNVFCIPITACSLNYLFQS